MSIDSNQHIEQLLECLVHVIGRVAVPLKEVQDIIGTGSKQVKAYNLCDGTRTQKQIATAAKVDQASLSRSFARWVHSGVAFWIGDGKEARLLHLYPIPTSSASARKKRGRRKE